MSGKKRKTLLVEKVRERIRAMASHAGPMPSLRNLAVELQVSLSTAWKAASSLESEGAISMHRGRRLQSGPNWPPIDAEGKNPRPEQAWESLARTIRKKVQSGEWKSGQALPSQKFLVRELHHTERTVRRALATLVEENLLHRKGKQWWVGPENIQVVEGRRPMEMPLLVYSTHSWAGLATAPRTRGFCDALAQEAAKHKIRLSLCFANDGFHSGPSVAAGRRAIRRYFQALDGRALGCLVALSSKDRVDLGQWLGWMGRLTPKFTWWDRYGEGWPPGTATRGWRCYFEEAAGIALAAETLHGLGHRRVLYMDYQQAGWRHARGERLRQELETRNSRIRFFTNPFGLHSGETRPEAAADRVFEFYASHSWGAALFSKVTAALSSDPVLPDSRLSSRQWWRAFVSRALVEMGQENFSHPLWTDWIQLLLFHLPGILQKRATALVVSHDEVSKRAYMRLESLGLRFPEHVSFLSFDNYPVTIGYPISSVDFGMAALGYRAFHGLFGAIPGMDRKKDFGSRPFLNHEGSLGPPRGAKTTIRILGVPEIL